MASCDRKCQWLPPLPSCRTFRANAFIATDS